MNSTNHSKVKRKALNSGSKIPKKEFCQVPSEEEEATKLCDSISSMDPVRLWDIVRRRILSHFSLLDLMWDVCSRPIDKRKDLTSPNQILQLVMNEIGVLLEELAAVLEECPEDDPDHVTTESDLLARCLGLSSDLKCKLKPLEVLQPKIRKYISHQGDNVVPFGTDKVLEIKMETFEDSEDEFSHNDDLTSRSDYDENDVKSEINGEEKDKSDADDESAKRQRQFQNNKHGTCHENKATKKQQADNIEEDSIDENTLDKNETASRFLSRSVGPPFDCHICGTSFCAYSTYRYHIRKCEGTPRRKKPPFLRVDKRYYCSHADCLRQPNSNGVQGPSQDQESWSSVTYIWRHFSEAHATDEDLVHHCTYCPEKFLTKSLLKTHINHKHELRFTCRFCGLSFALGTTLKKHERVHTGEKPFRCDHCQFKCSRTSSLRTHERRKHGVGVPGGPAPSTLPGWAPIPAKLSPEPTGKPAKPAPPSHGRSHVCEVCGKAFYTRQTLQDHHVTHTGARPYMCPVCGKTLRNDSCLRRHMMGVHGIKHTCNICAKDFSSKSGLQHHQRDFHDIHF